MSSANQSAGGGGGRGHGRGGKKQVWVEKQNRVSQESGVEPELPTPPPKLPPRYGYPTCQAYLTSVCTYGLYCKFYHPSDQSTSMTTPDSSLPPRADDVLLCPLYKEHGRCIYGLTCVFNHITKGADNEVVERNRFP